jgi:hypothetical protein
VKLRKEGKMNEKEKKINYILYCLRKYKYPEVALFFRIKELEAELAVNKEERWKKSAPVLFATLNLG